MANICTNKLVVSGSPAEVQKFVQMAEGPGGVTWKDSDEPIPHFHSWRKFTLRPDKDPVEKLWTYDPDFEPHSVLSLPKLVSPGEAATQLPWEYPIVAETHEEWYSQITARLKERDTPRDGKEWERLNWGTSGVYAKPDQRTLMEGCAVYTFDSRWSSISTALSHFALDWFLFDFHLRFLIEMGPYGEVKYVAGHLVSCFQREPRPEDLRLFSGFADFEVKGTGDNCDKATLEVTSSEPAEPALKVA